MSKWTNGAEWQPTQDLPEGFFELYPEIYRTELPNAPGEYEQFIRFQFSAAHDYFHSGHAWLAFRPKQARLCGFVQKNIGQQGRKLGYFGFWETRDDLPLNRQLFHELEEWMRSQGAELLLGPVNFTTFSLYRLREDAGADEDIFTGEPISPRYYSRLMRDLGFKIVESYSSWIVDPHPELSSHLMTMQQNLPQTALLQYQLEPITMDVWRQQLPDFYQLTNEIFSANPAFVPISFSDFQHYMGDMLGQRLCPISSVMAKDSQGKIIAYVIGLPHYGSLVKVGVEGSIKPEEVCFARCFPLLKQKIIIGKTLGVHPAHRGHGLQSLLYVHSLQQALGKGGYQNYAMALMRDGNASQKLKPPYPCQDRRYSLYGKSLKGNI